MKKFLKITSITIVLLLIVLISIPFLFKEKLQEIAKQEINKKLNAKIEFGDFNLSIFKGFPNLNVELTKVSVVGVDSFATDTLAAFQSFSANVDIMSVIFGDKIEIKSITLDQPQIKGKVLKSGKANWDIVKAISDSTAIDTAKSEPSKFQLGLKKFEIIDANIVYEDRSANIDAEIKKLNFLLKGDLSQDFTSLSTETNIEAITVQMGGISYLKKTKIEVLADLDADLAKSKYTFKENVVRLNELELGFNGFVEMLSNDIKMDMKFNAKKTEFKNILSLIPVVYMKDFEKVKTAGKLALDGYAKGTYNEKSLPAFGLNLLVENAMFKYPNLPGSVDNINIDLNVKNEDGIDDHTVINLKKFHVEFSKNPFDARMLVETPISDPQIDGEVKGTINLSKMNEIVPLDSMTLSGILTADVTLNGRLSSIEKEKYEEFKALGKIDLENFNYESADLPQKVLITKTSLLFSPQFVELTKFDAKIGKSDISADGKIENFISYFFKEELLKGRFNMRSNVLDLNELMGSSEETAPAATDTTSSQLSVIEVPSNIDFVLQTKLAKLFYDKLEITNVAGEVIVKDSKIDMKQLKMNLLDGFLSLNGSYSTVNIDKPVVDFGLDISNWDIPKTCTAFNTVQKLAPIAEKCIGEFSAKLKLTTDLDAQLSPIMNSIQSDGELSTKSVKVTQSDVVSKIADQLKIKKLNQDIAFSDVDLLFAIKDGKLTIEPFDTKFNNYKSTFGGWQGLDQVLGYTLNIDIPRSEFGAEANKVLDNMFAQAGKKGVNVNMNEVIKVAIGIGGTISTPKITANLKDQMSNAIDNIKDQVVDQVKQELGNKKEEALKKAKEQAAKLLAEADAKGKQLVSAAENIAQQGNATAKQAADKIRSEADTEAKKLIKEAGGNPLKKTVAEKAADKLRKEANNKADKVEKEAASKGQQGVDKAKTEAANLNNKAKEEGDKLIKQAEAI